MESLPYFCYTVDPWTPWVWTELVNLYMEFFSRNIRSALASLGFTSVIQPKMDRKQYFLSMIGNAWKWRANCMHCSMPFYMRDLIIWGFWYLQGILEPVSCRYPRTIVNLGGVKSYMQIFHCVGVSALNRCVTQMT